MDTLKNKLNKFFLSIFFLLSLVFCSLPLSRAQQNPSTLLVQIEQNNPMLASLKENIKAKIIENKTGIYLEDPEVEFGYLFGAPSEIGNRVDFGLSQSFDFPTAYNLRKKLANEKNDLSQLDYEIEKMAVFMECRALFTELKTNLKQSQALLRRLDHATQIQESYALKLKNGAATIFDFNKAKLHQLNISQEVQKLKNEMHFLRAQLIRLNGGKEIDFSTLKFISNDLPDSFEKWYSTASQKNPLISKSW